MPNSLVKGNYRISTLYKKLSLSDKEQILGTSGLWGCFHILQKKGKR